MKGIIADVNIQGHVDHLVVLMNAEPWKIFWDDLQLDYLHFSAVGLTRESRDSVIWETCQSAELVLITDNRNRNDPDSLESTIQAHNNPTKLPVFTVANVPRLRRSRAYADRVIDKMLDFLGRMDSLRGTGRLYVP